MQIVAKKRENMIHQHSHKTVHRTAVVKATHTQQTIKYVRSILSAALSRFHRTVDRIAFLMCAHLKFYSVCLDTVISFFVVASFMITAQWLQSQHINSCWAHRMRILKFKPTNEKKRHNWRRTTSRSTRYKINYVHLFSRRKVINHFMCGTSFFFAQWK